MREFLRFFRSIEWPVQAVGAGALLLWLFKAIVLNRFHAPQPLPDLGDVFEGLFSAAISGYVFYVIFALWPEFKARSMMAPYVCRQISLIHGAYGNIKRNISDASKIDLFAKGVGEDVVLSAFQKIPYNSRPPFTPFVPGRLNGFTWIEFFEYRRVQTEKTINELLQHNRFMDERLVSILTHVLHNKFFFGFQGISGLQVSNPDLAAWGVGFPDYMRVCHELAQWHDRHAPASMPKLISSLQSS